MAKSAEPNPCKLKRPTSLWKKKVWDDIAIKVNSLGVAIRTASEVRNKWRNTTRVTKAVYTTYRSEVFQTGGGPAPKQPSSAVEKVIHLMGTPPASGGFRVDLKPNHSRQLSK
ncbi:Hypothetical predicted protein [Mytilus galloprovincialis]|uniref:Myb/SANT-like DNA-binding domain-containing protein n=1 Tax=Mytilus galloprovincialis TaxID=29158 RepID=A0A8B6F8E8_MYTGA|nr:Hypothetical predicted protein [Mytilus galloprovincialis]